jgi:hypothetical protein
MDALVVVRVQSTESSNSSDALFGFTKIKFIGEAKDGT